MIFLDLMHIIAMIFLAKISFGLSAHAIPKINHLSERSDFNPTEKPIRTLETTPFPYSFIDEKGRVQVNLGESYYQKSPINPQASILMVLTISSNETGLFAVSEDFGFPAGFKCDPSYCDSDNSLIKYKSSWTMGDATRINLNNSISIASGAWQLHTSPLYFSKVPRYFLRGAGREIGWLGLGTGSEARKNFQAKNPIFSMVFDSHSKTGNLIFGFNATLADDSKPVTTATATPNWEMQLASVSVGDKSIFLVNSSHPLNIIFDLKDQNPSLPEEMVDSIINELSYYTTGCLEYNCFPETREGLPPIVFTLTDNTQFSLSPEIYVQNHKYDDGNTGYYTMNMLFKYRTGFAQNTIFFGTSILSYFYTVFQQMDEINTITFYAVAPNVIIEQEHSTPLSMQPEQPGQQGIKKTSDLTFSFDLKYPIIGCVTITILLICVRLSRGKKSRVESNSHSNKNRKMNMELSQSDGDEIPLRI